MARFGTTVFPRIRIGIGAGRYIYLPVLTTTQRNLLSASAGYLVYNSTTTQVECYNGSSWVAVGKLYGDATFLPLAGGTLTGNIAMAGAQTVDGVDISAHAVDLDAHMADVFQTIRTGEYWANNADFGGVLQLAANTLYAAPLVFVRPISIDRVACHISTQAGQAIRLGIYNDGTNLYPGTLLKDAGAITLSGTGVQAVTLSPAVSLGRGVYWFAIVSDGTPTIRKSEQYHQPTTVLGLSATDFDVMNMGWSVAFTYAALPTPFTAGGSQTATNVMCIPRILTLD